MFSTKNWWNGQGKKSSITGSKRETEDGLRNENLMSTKTGLNTVSYLNTIHYFQESYL